MWAGITYLDHGGVRLIGSDSEHVPVAVHQDGVSLHIFSVQLETLGCVDNSGLL